ncbi:CD3072 family TudS-related putative desulfidase [Acidaminobacter hydrogenoformans]|uniref:Predicted secreted protein n=1 Tax=Acidaminobacter hydrogenoformans DSM 2784 TaxID=1120920 RepID=A0A1G5RSP8_9FIRM|nr:CD3072 family TudS-related putative desulfidase [Acidaminobacter hydrogenoformans]SCZ76451.1 Predicted secreted protein [Acidaminobacter hydrogenoformans DSM 2784]
MRNKKLIILAHCLLNQNSTLLGWERAPGPFPELLSLLSEHQVSILQLPCPELAYLGLERPPMTFEEYNTFEYKVHCIHMLKPFSMQLRHYLNHDYEILGILGIEESPSCDINNSRGVFMKALRVTMNALKSGSFEAADKLDLPEVLDGENYERYLSSLRNLIAEFEVK